MKVNAQFDELRFFLYAWRQLQKIGKQLHRLDEGKCNSGLTKRQQIRRVKLEQNACEIAKDMGFTIYHQGDPRGCSLYLCQQNGENLHVTYLNGIAVY